MSTLGSFNTFKPYQNVSISRKFSGFNLMIIIFCGFNLMIFPTSGHSPVSFFFGFLMGFIKLSRIYLYFFLSHKIPLRGVGVVF